MKVLNVDYLNQFDLFPIWFQNIILLTVAVSLIVSLIFSVALQEDGTFWCIAIPWVIFIISCGILLIAGKIKTPYIEYKEVVFTEDTIPIEIVQTYNIESIRGEIYRLTPKERMREESDNS